MNETKIQYLPSRDNFSSLFSSSSDAGVSSSCEEPSKLNWKLLQRRKGKIIFYAILALRSIYSFLCCLCLTSFFLYRVFIFGFTHLNRNVFGVGSSSGRHHPSSIWYTPSAASFKNVRSGRTGMTVKEQVQRWGRERGRRKVRKGTELAYLYASIVPSKKMGKLSIRESEGNEEYK